LPDGGNMADGSMSLPVQSFRLSEVAEDGMDLGGFGAEMERAGPLPMRVLGECFAFDNRQLDEEARRDGIGWHLWSLRQVVVGLWHERSRNKAYVCLTLHPGVTRVFFCSHQEDWPEKFYEIISATTAFMDSGRDSFPPGYAW